MNPQPQATPGAARPESKGVSSFQWRRDRSMPLARVPLAACPPVRAAILAVLAVMLLAAAVQPLAQAQFGPAQVAVAPVQQREVLAGQTFVGTVKPLRTSAVGAPVDGRVDEFPINEGDRVQKGQVLAKLRTKTIEMELASAKGMLAMHKQELAELQNGTRPEEVEQAKARMAKAEAWMRYARAKQQRTQNLLAQGRAATEEEMQEIVSAADQAEHAHREAKLAHDLAVKGPRTEKIAQLQARVTAQEAEVGRLEDILDKHTIRAPFDGYVTAEHTEVGQWITKGAVVADVVELDEVDVEAHVLEDYAGNVHVGAPARVEIPALSKEVFTGKVSLIVPQANVKARTFPIKVRLPNRRSGDEVLLKAGMMARVTLSVGKKEQALLVSKDALVLGGPAPNICVVDADPKNPKAGKVRLAAVELGVADGSDIQVKGQLKAGEQVVVQGNERLMPGQEIVVTKVIEPAKPPMK